MGGPSATLQENWTVQILVDHGTYLIGYYWVMSVGSLLLRARRAAGLPQGVLASRAGTSRPTLSAYEHGRKSPSLATAARIVGEAGFELSLEPKAEFVNRGNGRGRPVLVPTSLPRLTAAEAFALVELPLHLNWSDVGRRYSLADRADRARVYEIVLREGGPSDVLAYVDGLLLVDLWDDLVLPAEIRAAWAPLVSDSHHSDAA